MLILLSPAKTLDFSHIHTPAVTEPRLLASSKKLVRTLRKKSAAELQFLLRISEKLAAQNYERYQQFTTPFTTHNAKPAVLAFKGDVYLGLEADTFSEAELTFAQSHLRILSGLYGVLRPLDLMQAYRLEMGTRLAYNGTSNLYEFWGDRITRLLNTDLRDSGSDTILNLASQEYFKAVDTDKLKGNLLTIHFKEKRNDKYQVIAFNAKKARGRMAHLIVKEGITDPADLQELVINDYIYNADLSTPTDWLYTF